MTPRRIRKLLRERVGMQRSADDVTLRIIDGLDLFGGDDTDALPDGLHPGADGYRTAKRFSPPTA
jgi:hypothetical protein